MTAFSRGLFLLILLIGSQSFALIAEPATLVLWRRGEAIDGLDFLSANEAVLDYLATLPRPTGSFQIKKYACMAKYRTVGWYIESQPPGSGGSRLYLPMVYDLTDCVEKSP